MRNTRSILGAALVLVLLLAGGGAFLFSQRDNGTQLGVQACIESNEDSAVANSLVRKKCLEKHEQKLASDVIDLQLSFVAGRFMSGRGNYSDEEWANLHRIRREIVEGNDATGRAGTYKPVFLSVRLKNQSEDVNISRVVLRVRHDDNPAGSETIKLAVRSGGRTIHARWLQPYQAKKYTIPLTFAPERTRLDVSLWDWTVEEVHGVKIKLQ